MPVCQHRSYALFKFLKYEPYNDRKMFTTCFDNKYLNAGDNLQRLHLATSAVLLRRTEKSTIDGKQVLSLPECKKGG